MVWGMDFFKQTVTELAGTVTGLLLAGLVSVVVVLIALIILRKSRTEPDEDEVLEDETPGDVTDVIELDRAQGEPKEKAERFAILADQALHEGRLGDAKDLYNKALAFSQDNGFDEITAVARFELANLAKANGDLTTACEYWQMARELYVGLEDKKKVREIDAIMRAAQCPSDWVLTDF